MRVILDVNLKIGSNRIISAGSAFSDDEGPIPEFILRRLRRKQAHVVPDLPKKNPVPGPTASVREKVPEAVGKVLGGGKIEKKTRIPRINKIST